MSCSHAYNKTAQKGVVNWLSYSKIAIVASADFGRNE